MSVEFVGDLLMVIGASFALIAAIGVHRFPDAYSQAHAAAKSPTLGLILVCLGAGLRLHSWSVSLTLLLVVILQLITSPVATHAISRAIHLRMPIPQDGVDELARDEHRGDAALDYGADGEG